MSGAVTIDTLPVLASDLTGQRSASVRAPLGATIGEWVEDVVAVLGLRPRDASGAPYTYHPRLEREGRHLNASEIVGEVLQADDRVVLQPNVSAGAAAGGGRRAHAAA